MNWEFIPLKFEGALTPMYQTLEVQANWKDMEPYCRYCHMADHAVADCPKRKARITCFNCNATGHIRAQCPRNAPSSTGKKTRKLPTHGKPVIIAKDGTEKTEVPETKTNEDVDTEKKETITIEEEKVAEPSSGQGNTQATKEIETVEIDTRRNQENNTDPKNTSSTVKTTEKVCPHCSLSGHVRTTSKFCLMNKHNIKQRSNAEEASESAAEDVSMDDNGSDF